MKPDGKIQGVDVWVRRYCSNINEWCIANGFANTPATTRWIKENGGFCSGGLTRLFPTREAALTHLRTLEAKERPVIDLTAAKFGDKFKRASGEIETYACPREGFQGSHVMQSGQIYGDRGYWESGPSIVANLVAPYTPPRTVEVWIEVYERPGCGTIAAAVYMSEAELRQGLQRSIIAKARTLATSKLTLTEGEGLAEPDVV